MDKVELTGRAGAIFTRNGRTMQVDGELMAAGDEWVLYGASVGLWDDDSEASDAEKKEIIQTIIDLLAKDGMKVVID